MYHLRILHESLRVMFIIKWDLNISSSNIFHSIQQCAVAIITFGLKVSIKFEYHTIDIHFKERAFLELGT